MLRAIRFPLLFSIAGLWLVLLAAEKVHPCFFLHDDNASWFTGAYIHDFRVLTETGRLAEVNYYQHAGEPFLQEGQTSVLYPPVYLGVALAKEFSGDLRWSIEWITAVDLTLGLIGFYFWLRQGGVRSWHAALGGLAWVLNPFVFFVGESWVFVTFVVAWLPWMFWALDRLLARPSARNALFLGISAALLFLQGYVQMFAYAALFLVLYALFQFVTRRETRKSVVFYYLFLAVLIFAIFSLPLLLPLIHAANDSAMRYGALPIEAALEYSVFPTETMLAQICHFRTNEAFGVSSGILYCPALLFIPVVVVRFFYVSRATRLRLGALLLLALAALIFSSRGHWLLSMLPVFDRFRWPFKVYIFVDFFMIASFVWTTASWAESRPSSAWRVNLTATICLTVLVLANLSISLAFHDDNPLSRVILPPSDNPLVPGMDPRLGRVVTFADGLPEDRTYHYLSLAYATYYGFPSLGGYNPLVGLKQLEYAYYLDYPNYCTGTMTRDFQKIFETRCVRYWFVDPHSSQFTTIKNLPGMRVMDAEADRVVFEDTQAAPVVCTQAAPTVACAMRFSGNSILIPLDGVSSPVKVSVGPTDGWWYRIDHGPWLKPPYEDYRLNIDFKNSAHLLEVSYFDPRFHAGLLWSLAILLFLVVLETAPRVFPQFRAR